MPLKGLKIPYIVVKTADGTRVAQKKMLDKASGKWYNNTCVERKGCAKTNLENDTEREGRASTGRGDPGDRGAEVEGKTVRIL